jgi:putative transposase
MSFASKHFEFMQPVLTAHDLGLPVVEPDEIDGQKYEFESGDRLLIFTEDRTGYSEVRFKEEIRLSVSKCSLLVFTRLESNEQVTLTTSGVAQLEKAGRIVPVGPTGNRCMPASAMTLSEERRKDAERAMAIVDRYYALRETHGVARLSKKISIAFLVDIATERGEEAMSYRWLMTKLSADAAGTRFDRLMNFARKKRRGNETARKSTLVYEALEIAAHFAWSRPNGTYKTMQDHFLWLLENKERFAPARREALHPGGGLAIAKSTFDEHFSNVDLYTRDLLRFGAEKAAVRNRQYIRMHRPMSALDIVDVDHVTTDLYAYLDQNPLAFGRLDLVVFRDRATGIWLGYALGFGAPSYTTFLRGLEHAIFEKDKERLYNGVQWPWWGMFSRLGVDNAMHFVSDSIEATSRALGFAITEFRPASPGDKGALERSLGTLQQELFHGLPGTTMSSPEMRKMFGQDREISVPVLALSEVEAVLQYWVSRVHHQTPRQGLGGDLLTEAGVPADLWEKHRKAQPPRPLIDRTMFARLAGQRKRVTVQKDGIRAEGVHYYSPALLPLYLHPKTKRARVGHRSTRFEMTINVNDISQAWVHDPHRDVMIEVAPVGPDAEYCENMSLEVHRMIQNYRRDKRREKENAPSLLEARRELHGMIMDLIGAARKKFDPRKKLARFIGSQVTADRRRKVVEMAKRREDGSFDWSHTASAAPDEVVIPVPEDFDETVIPEAEPESAAETNAPSPTPRKTRPKTEKKAAKPTDLATRDISDIAATLPDWDD